MYPPSVARIAADLTSTDAIERNKIDDKPVLNLKKKHEAA